MLDYRSATPNIATDMGRVPHLGQWRRVIIASSAFPRSVSAMQQQQWVSVPRGDWMAYKAAAVDGQPARRLTFADYTLRDHGAAASGGNPPVTLKYTTDESWLVRVDGRHQAGEAGNMLQICASLVGRDEFCGPDFSRGDAEIAARAGGNEERPGGPQQWLQWGVNHHIEFVTAQLDATSTHGGPPQAPATAAAMP